MTAPKTATLKAEAMAWLRYGKRLPIVTTEVGNWYADVLGMSKDISVEVETKVSRADLRAEFRNKAAKHHLYQNCTGATKSVPNYMYFLVPEELKDAALEIVTQGNPKAGVAVFTDEGGIAGRNVSVVKNPVKLHDSKPSPKAMRVAIMRMSSELCGLWIQHTGALAGLASSVYEHVRQLTAGVVTAALKQGSVLDVEDPSKDLEIRAQELALAVDGVQWDTLDEPGKDRWLAAAKRYVEISDETAREWEIASKSL